MLHDAVLQQVHSYAREESFIAMRPQGPTGLCCSQCKFPFITSLTAWRRRSTRSSSFRGMAHTPILFSHPANRTRNSVGAGEAVHGCAVEQRQTQRVMQHRQCKACIPCRAGVDGICVDGNTRAWYDNFDVNKYTEKTPERQEKQGFYRKSAWHCSVRRKEQKTDGTTDNWTGSGRRRHEMCL